MPVHSSLEKALLRERLLVFIGLGGVVIVCWGYLLAASIDMYGAMDGLSAWMMSANWDAEYFLLIFLMWSVMMIGMMLPSAAPVILLYGLVVRKDATVSSAVSQIYAFAAGYLLAWTVFSLLATVTQALLSQALLLTPMMESGNTRFGAAVLIVAGAYQWSPLKQSCLTLCRSPAEFIARYWQKGRAGALRMGLRHGWICIGCCWALMLLLFFGGVMNFWWIAAITLFVLLEKIAPLGAGGGKLSGAALIASGLAVLLGWL